MQQTSGGWVSLGEGLGRMKGAGALVEEDACVCTTSRLGTPARAGLQFCEMQPLRKVVPRSVGSPCVVSYDCSESTIVSK